MSSVARSWPVLTLLASAACSDRPPESDTRLRTEWLSEPDYHIGDAMAGEAVFGRVPYLYVSPDGQRIFVLEPDQARVTVWTPGGRLLLDLGGTGEGPGDFMLPYRIHAWESGFYVRDMTRFTVFSSDGAIVRTVPNPPTLVGYQGFQIRAGAILDDGGFLGYPDIPASVRLGLWGDDPIDSLPLLRVWESDAGWSREPVVWRSIRNATLHVPYDDGMLMAGQPFGDSDPYRLDRGAGTVVVARMRRDHLGPGEVEFLEVSAAGDTVWQRRLAFQPIRLTRPMLEEAIDENAPLMKRHEDENQLGGRSAREVVEDALYIPEYLPAFDVFLLASSGRHIWLRSHERVDTLRVWYSIERNDRESPPRRVLLPESVRFWNMTDTHAWGIGKDELDINHVVGRRLVPPS